MCGVCHRIDPRCRHVVVLDAMRCDATAKHRTVRYGTVATRPFPLPDEWHRKPHTVRVVWRNVAWCGVMWRGVMRRGVAWRTCRSRRPVLPTMAVRSTQESETPHGAVARPTSKGKGTAHQGKGTAPQSGPVSTSACFVCCVRASTPPVRTAGQRR